MKHKRFSVEQIVTILKQAEMGMPVAEVIRRVGISEQTFYRWKKQFTGLEIDQVRQLKQLQDENGRLKKLVAELTLLISLIHTCELSGSNAFDYLTELQRNAAELASPSPMEAVELF